MDKDILDDPTTENKKTCYNKDNVKLKNIIKDIRIDTNLERTIALLQNMLLSAIPFDKLNFVEVDVLKNQIYQIDVEASSRRICFHSFNECSFKEIVDLKKPLIIKNLNQRLNHYQHCQFIMLKIDEGLKSSIALPIYTENTCIGVLVLSSSKGNTYTNNHLNVLEMISKKISFLINQGLLLEELIVATINGFAKLVEAKDSCTGKHIQNIKDYSFLLAHELTKLPEYSKIIDENFLKDIYNFSTLHDIGKAHIPDSILLKPAKLTYEEFNIIKTHTTLGAQILEEMQSKLSSHRNRFYQTAIEIAKSHHEKYDGSGYPKGLKGENIPLSARIVAISDVFDALTSERPYKKAFTFEEAFRIIESEANKQFDPVIVDVFMKNKAQIMELYGKNK